MLRMDMKLRAVALSLYSMPYNWLAGSICFNLDESFGQVMKFT